MPTSSWIIACTAQHSQHTVQQTVFQKPPCTKLCGVPLFNDAGCLSATKKRMALQLHVKPVPRPASGLTWYVHWVSRGVTGSSFLSNSNTSGLLRLPKSNTPTCKLTAEQWSLELLIGDQHLVSPTMWLLVQARTHCTMCAIANCFNKCSMSACSNNRVLPATPAACT
jgi:hypothetical protein